MSSKPLAEIMRPDKLEDVVGQSHLIDSGQIIREIIKNKNPTSLILKITKTKIPAILIL